MQYAVVLERDGDGWLATFPGVPEAITGGGSREDALANAVEALELSLLTYLKDGRPLPPPDTSSGESVALSAAAVAKIAFIEAFQRSGLTQSALARKLGKAETEVRRMLDFYHPTKLPALEASLKALGKRLVVTVQEAA